MKNATLITAFITLAALSIFTGCKKDDNTKSTVTNGTLWFHIHTNIDSAEAESGGVYAIHDSINSSTRNLTIDSTTYTLTNIRLVKSTGDTQTVTGTVKYIFETEQYQVASIPIGTYKSVAFELQDLIVKGHVDTGHSGGNLPTTNYSFAQTGGATVKLPAHSVSFSTDFTITENQSTFIHLIGDYDLLFKGIDLENVQTTTPTVTAHISTNIPNMFRYEE